MPGGAGGGARSGRAGTRPSAARDGASAASASAAAAAIGGGGQLQIREDPERGVFVSGAAQLSVTASEHVFEALALGATQRSTASTHMNERSSRIHSIFQLYITQKRLTP